MIKTDFLVNSVLYVSSVCIAVLVCLCGLRKSMENLFLRRRRTLRGAGCRLAGEVITVWKIMVTQIKLYCSVPMKTDCLAQSSY